MSTSWTVNDDNCWVWTGKVIRNRAVKFNGGVYHNAGRLEWLQLYGDILPTKTHVERVCRQLACVQPRHHVLKGWASVARRQGRKAREVSAVGAVLPVLYPNLCWNPQRLSELNLEPEIVADIARRLSTPPIVVHAAYRRLMMRHSSASPAAEGLALSDETIAKAKALLDSATGNHPHSPSHLGGWLPPI